MEGELVECASHTVVLSVYIPSEESSACVPN